LGTGSRVYETGAGGGQVGDVRPWGGVNDDLWGATGGQRGGGVSYTHLTDVKTLPTRGSERHAVPVSVSGPLL
jgi:hypothetical protein